jgi:hypothetical protein
MPEGFPKYQQAQPGDETDDGYGTRQNEVTPFRQRGQSNGGGSGKQKAGRCVRNREQTAETHGRRRRQQPDRRQR